MPPPGSEVKTRDVSREARDRRGRWTTSGSSLPGRATAALDALQRRWPTDRKVEITFKPLADKVAGTTWTDTPGVARMELNSDLTEPDSAVSRHFAAAVQGGHISAPFADPLVGAIYHEWGHVLQADNEGWQRRVYDDMARQSRAEQRALWRAVTTYGKGHADESLSEGFAEWAHTGGQTANPWAQLVGRRIRR